MCLTNERLLCGMEVNEIKESSNLGLEVEQILKKFNIGAFLSPSLWGLAHGKPIGLLFFFLSFIPFLGVVAGLAGGVWFGMNGNRWAWKNCKHKNLQKFNESQERWACGMLIFVLIVGIIYCAILFGW